MRRIAIYILTTFVVLSLLSSCKKELPTEAGEWKDSYIVEFALTVQGKTYQGSIEGNKITVQIPEGVDLKGAAVECKLSEGASIEPDPKSVSDWSAERKFVVTSKSQESRNYMYSPVFTKPIQVGSVVLATQEDVNKFKGTKITAIEGDLIIGTASGEKITNLDSLAYLKQVGGALKINASYDGVDFSGLKSLETVGSFLLGTCLDTSRCAKVKEVSLPSLSEVNGDFVVRCGTVESVSIPKVKSIKGEVFVTSRTLKSVVVSLLEEVRGSLVLQGAMKTEVDAKTGQIKYASNAAIEAVGFDVLSSVGGKLEVQYFRSLESVYFPVLNRIGGSLKINNILKLGSIALSELSEVGGFECSDNSKLQQISLPKLKKCMGYFYVASGEVSLEFDISSLEIQDADMMLADMYCKEVVLNPLFDLRGHTLEINGSNGLEKLSGPSTLDGNLKFDLLQYVDVFTVEGISKLMGSLVIQNSSSSKFSFPFTEIGGGLDWDCKKNEIDMKSLQKIGRVNIISVGNSKYDFSGLKEIVGESSIKILDKPSINLSSLEKVGKDFKVMLSWRAGGSFTCPKLSNVAGAFRFTMAPDVKNSPAVYTVDFSGLTSVRSVTITGQKWLTDFTMFKGLFPKENPAIATANQWTVSDCGYNPTFDDMTKGFYTQKLKEEN